MVYKYKQTTRMVEPRPRSERLRRMGVSTTAAAAPSVLQETYTAAPPDWFVPVELDAGVALQLNSAYIGLYAEGFISSMGLSTTSGVSIHALNDIGDVDVPSPEDGQVLTWDSDSQKWVATTPESGGGGGVTSLYALSEVLSSTSPSRNDLFYFNGSKWTNLSKAALLSGYATENYVSRNYQPLDQNLTSISRFKSGDEGFLKRNADGTWALDDVDNYFELSTVNGKTYVKVKDEYAGLYAMGSISALGLSGTSGGSGGGASELNDLDDVTLSPAITGDDVLTYSNGRWTNIQKATLLSGYATVSQLAEYQPRDSDLTAIAALMGSGYLRRSSEGAWSLNGAFIGRTEVQQDAGVQDLDGIGHILPDENGTYDLGNPLFRWGSIYVDTITLGPGSPLLYWDLKNNCWHLTGNFAADGWVSAKGVSNT